MTRRKINKSFLYLVNAVAVALLVLTSAFVRITETKAWNFDNMPVGNFPAGFESAYTGDGTEGRWTVEADKTAPSPPNVILQSAHGDIDEAYRLLIAKDVAYDNIKLSVKFKALSGKMDQGGGLVFRYQDPENYYVVRVNVNSNNIRLFRVVNSARAQLEGAIGDVKSTQNFWHELGVEAQGNVIKCYFDGELVFEKTDNTFARGRVGLWTKSDSVTLFDDLVTESL
jgi:hypothetical protein